MSELSQTQVDIALTLGQCSHELAPAIGFILGTVT
jgi:hypothetical protein